MKTDQIYDCGPKISAQGISDFFNTIGHAAPLQYVNFIKACNGGMVHPTMSKMSNEDSLVKLFQVGLGTAGSESVQLMNFDVDECSIPEDLLPLLNIGRTWDSNLFLSLNPKTNGNLALYSASYDEFLAIEGTIETLLNSLTRTESIANTLEPDDVHGSPWDLVRLGEYEKILHTLDNGKVDVNQACPNDERGRTLLMLAFQGRRESLCEKLLKRGALPDQRDLNGIPTFFYARDFRSGLSMAQHAGVDFNAVDSEGNGILHFLAVESHYMTGGETSCFQWLVENGGASNVANAKGTKPRDILLAKVDEFKKHYTSQPYMLSNLPFPLSKKLELLSD